MSDVDTALAVLIRAAAGDMIVNKSQVRPSSEVSNIITDPKPLIIYSQLNAQRDMTDDGPAGVVTALFNVDIYCTKATEARAVANEIRAELDGYASTSGGTKIDLIEVRREKLLQVQMQEGANQQVARMAIEMIVIYRD